MAVRRKARAATTQGGELRISLLGPGMTALHRVGVAGLYMTLQALEQDTAALEAIRRVGGGWELGADSVRLVWSNDGSVFFQELIKWSFPAPRYGLLTLPAFGDPFDRPQHSLSVHNALLGTFLQHGLTRKADNGARPGGALVIGIDETPTELVYQRVFSYAHQSAVVKPGVEGKVLGWLYPGGAERHVGLSKISTLTEPPERLLPLLYAPVGGVFFRIGSRRTRARPLHCLVLPEVADLRRYARWRKGFASTPLERFQAPGAATAALRVLVAEQAEGVLSGARSLACRVVAFGTVPWAPQQKTRIDVFPVQAGSRAEIVPFRAADELFRAQLVRSPQGEPWWRVPQTPELVARNVALGKPWWLGFSDFLNTLESDARRWLFRRENGGLHSMVLSEEVFPDGPERAFVLACHEAWRKRLGALGERARDQHLDFFDLSRKEFERLRIAFSRCKSAPLFRQTITDFWAQSGSLGPLHEQWPAVLPFLDDRRWRAGRDLALLALASYQGAGADDEQDPPPIQDQPVN